MTAPVPDRHDPEQTKKGIRGGTASFELGSTSPSSFSQGPQDEWDRKVKKNYEAGGELKRRAEKALEDYRTGNTSPLP